MLSLWNTGSRGPDPSTRSSPGASRGGVISVSCIRTIESASEGVLEGVSEDVSEGVLEEDQVMSWHLSWRGNICVMYTHGRECVERMCWRVC